MKVFSGMMTAIVASTEEPGKITLEATAKGFEESHPRHREQITLTRGTRRAHCTTPASPERRGGVFLSPPPACWIIKTMSRISSPGYRVVARND